MTEILDAYRRTAAQLLVDRDSPEFLTHQYTLLSTTPNKRRFRVVT
jgi:hypothetical protein